MTSSPDEARQPRDDDSRKGETLTLRVTLGRASFKAEGDAAAVLEAFGYFQEFYAEHRPTAEEPEPEAEAEAEEPSGDIAQGSADEPKPNPKPAGDTSGSVPLSVFLAKKKLPRGNSIIALGIAVWAKRYKGEEVFTADTMKAFWRDSKKKVPANVPRDLGTAASEGWLERLATGGGNYGLTSYGEAHFDGLPEADG